MKKFTWQQFNNENPAICLSPMDGYTDSAMRRVSKEVNPEIVVFTEFTSADGLHHAPEKVKERFYFHESENPVVAQIYGGNVDTFRKAAKMCEEMGFAAIDINMGCPAKKVVKSEYGVALRRKLDVAFKLINVVAESTTLPVSVKTRLGWNDASDLVEFGLGAERAGAQLISIHGRTYQEPYGCPADYEPIYELKKAVKVPVFGNGGLTSLEDAHEKLGNLDGQLIGQAAIGNPWVFAPHDQQPKNFLEKIPLIERHIQYLIKDKGANLALLQIRKHLLAYVKGMKGAASYRKQLAVVKSVEEIQAILATIAADQHKYLQQNG